MKYKVLISNETRNMLALHIEFLLMSVKTFTEQKEKIINAIKIPFNDTRKIFFL